MQLQSSFPRSLLALLLIANVCQSQFAAIIVDDDGGAGVDFTDIAPAVAAAQPTDVVLVKTGVYSSFTVDAQSAVVTADEGASVLVQGQVWIRNTLASHSVAISGVNVFANQSSVAYLIENCAGPVLVERCSAVGDGIPLFLSNDGIRVTDSDAVTLVECAMSVSFNAGPADGLAIQNSSVHAWNCTAVGAKGFDEIQGGHGVEVVSSFLFAGGCTFTGGEGGDGTVSQPFQICSDGAQGGHGMFVRELGSPSLVKSRDTSYVAGPGGAPGDVTCNSGPLGDPTVILAGTLDLLPGGTRTYSIPSPTREGQPAFITWEGEPGDFVWIWFSGFQSPTFSNAAKGTLLPGAPDVLILIGPVGTSGTLTLPLVTGTTPGTDNFTLFEQGLFWNPTDKLLFANPRLGIILDESVP